MFKIPKQEYTAEFKELAVKRVESGQSIGMVAKELGLVEQTLRNWVKAAKAGKLHPPRAKSITPEQMELSRVRAENARLRMENEILKHHSDRGSQCASHAFQDKLTEYGMVCSMSRKANCWDNAPTESFFNSLKNERVHGTRYATRGEAIADLFAYIEPFYNRSRRHSTLGYKSPTQFMHDWITTQHERKSAA